MTLPSMTAQPMTASMPLPDNRLAVYFHIPFCRTRCTYCAFNTYTGQSERIAPYMHALQCEMHHVIGCSNHIKIDSIYLGGGTPSLVPVAEIAAVLDTCADVFTIAPEIEITLEANPGTVDQTYLRELQLAGINRLSIGMQSANTSELRLFGRRHYVDDVRWTADRARAVGINNISLDLIYGIPRQTLAMWRYSLDTAIKMAPNHLSLYSLGIEEATPMQRRIAHRELPQPNPDLAADMYEWASDRLSAAGFEQYEISNWAQPGFACRHNVHVWRNLPYLGLGAGAHGYAAQTRYANVCLPATYIERILSQQSPLPFPLSAAAEEVEHIDERNAMAETMILGMRLVGEGVSLNAFRARFGVDLWTVYGAQLDRRSRWGWWKSSAARGCG